MIYLINSLPNAVLLAGMSLGDTRELSVISEEDAARAITQNLFVSAVGHESTADLFTSRLGIAVEANRIQVAPKPGDVIYAGLFMSPRRLAEGELYSEEEILEMPINWVKVVF